MKKLSFIAIFVFASVFSETNATTTNNSEVVDNILQVEEYTCLDYAFSYADHAVGADSEDWAEVMFDEYCNCVDF